MSHETVQTVAIVPTTFTDADHAFLENLRNRGFAVAVFTPGELRGTPQDMVENTMVEHGTYAIEYYAGYEDEDEESEE